MKNILSLIAALTFIAANAYAAGLPAKGTPAGKDQPTSDKVMDKQMDTDAAGDGDDVPDTAIAEEPENTNKGQ